VSGKPLSIAFEEIAAAKATFIRIDPDELAAELEGVEAELEVVEAVAEVIEAVEEASEETETAEEPAEDEGPAAG
jgi:predicted ABC-type ATPase